MRYFVCGAACADVAVVSQPEEGLLLPSLSRMIGGTMGQAVGSNYDMYVLAVTAVAVIVQGNDEHIYELISF